MLYRRSRRGDRLCVPATSALRAQVLHELHTGTTPLGGHYGRDKTLALARRSVWWPGMPSVYMSTMYGVVARHAVGSCT